MRKKYGFHYLKRRGGLRICTSVKRPCQNNETKIWISLLKKKRRIENLYCSEKDGISAEILEQSMGARNRVGVGLSYRPARLLSLAESISCNKFLQGSLKV
jgi:hypothetical protein